MEQMSVEHSCAPNKIRTESRNAWASQPIGNLISIILILAVLMVGIDSIKTSNAFAKDVNSFNLPSSNLGMPENRLSYTMGVGDLDGDGDYDYLARVWIDDDIDRDFKTITYAVRNDGVILWEFHHNMSYRDTSGDPTWIVS